MRRAISVGLLLVLGIAYACKYEVPAFRAVATDGKLRSRAGLVGKPTIFVFLKLGCPGSPEAVPKLNRLASSLKGRVEVLGIIDADLASAKRYARKMNIHFPMVSDPQKQLLKAFGVKRSLEMTFSAPKSGAGRYPKIWDGYSRTTVQEILDGIAHHGVKLPKVSLSYFAKEKRAGCSL